MGFPASLKTKKCFFLFLHTSESDPFSSSPVGKQLSSKIDEAWFIKCV